MCSTLTEEIVVSLIVAHAHSNCTIRHNRVACVCVRGGSVRVRACVCMRVGSVCVCCVCVCVRMRGIHQVRPASCDMLYAWSVPLATSR